MKRIGKKQRPARMVVACLSSLALAAALVPAAVLSAWAEEAPQAEGDVQPPALTITAKDSTNTAADEVVVAEYSKADLSEMAKSYTAPMKYMFYSAKKKVATTVYSVKTYVPLSALLGSCPAWKEGSELKIFAGTEEYTSNTAPYTYEMINAKRYFFNKYYFEGTAGTNITHHNDGLDDVEQVETVLALDEASKKMETAGQLASEAVKSVGEFSEAQRLMLGVTEDSDATCKGGPLIASDSPSGVTKIQIAFEPSDMSKATVKLAKSSAAYTGKTQKPSVKSVELDGKALVAGTDYKVTATSGAKVGSYKATVEGDGVFYKGTATASFKITKASNKVTAKKTKVTKSYKAKKSAKKLGKTKKFSLPKVTAKFGTVKYKVSKKDSKKVLSLSGKEIKVKKTAKKGKTYTIKVKAYVKSTSNYKSASKTITVKVKIG